VKMSLRDWYRNGWIRKHSTSRQEIRNLIEIVHRDILDAENIDLSPDWRFGIAYNAALKLCTILLYAEGYRTERNLAHYRTIQALSLILGPGKQQDAQYLDVCRTKRNILEYDSIGSITHGDADELIVFCKELQAEVMKWLNENHSELGPAGLMEASPDGACG